MIFYTKDAELMV